MFLYYGHIRDDMVSLLHHIIIRRFLYYVMSSVLKIISLGPRPSPLRDLLRAFNCAGEGNIENGEGRPGMKHHVPIDVG